MNKIIKKVLILSFILVSSATHADNFIQFKISSLQLVSSFSSYIYFEGDNKNQLRLNQAKIRGDEALSELSISNQKLNLKWQQISDFLDSSQQREFDVNLEAAWSILQGELSHIIAEYENTLTSSKGAVGNDTTSENTIRHLQVKMETILSQYMAFANSTLGGYGINTKGAPLEDKIKAVSMEMAELAKQDAKYKSLANKWRYIERTLLAYNSNVAPFVVMHTFERMRKILAAY